MIEDIETYWHEVNDALHENLLSKVDSDEVEDNDDYFNEDDCIYIMMRIDMDGRRVFPYATEERIKSYFDFLKKRGIVHKYDIEKLDLINANIHLWIDKSYLDVQLFNEVLFCIIAIMKEYFTFGLSVEKFIDDDTFVKKLYIDNTNSKEAILIVNTNEYKNMFPNISETEYLSSIVKASAKYGLTRCIDREYDIYHLYIVREHDGEYIVYYDEANIRRLILRKNGEIIYEFQVKSLMIADKFDLFHNGLLAVYSFQKNEYYLMNRDGKFVGHKSFKDIVGFTANGVIVRLFEDNSVGLVDGKGNLIADNNYKVINQYSNGFAVVEYEDGGYNYIDTTGNELLTGNNFSCEDFDDDGYGIISNSNGIGVCNNKGKILFQSEKFKAISRVGNGLWVVRDKNHSDVNCNNLVNTKGKYLSKYWFYEYENSFHNGLMWICNSKLGYTFIDMKGDVLCKKDDGTPEWFTDCGCFDEGGNAIVLRNNKMNFIDKSGNLISRKWFDKQVGIDLSVSQFSEDFAIVMDKKNVLITKFNFIDRTGMILSKFWFEGVESNFKNGYAVVKIDNHLGIIDKYGVMVHSDYSKYSKIDVFIDGIARVQSYDGKWNCIRTDGTLVLKEWYRSIIRCECVKNIFEVSKTNEKGKIEYSFCNTNGKFILGKRWFNSGRFNINTYVDSIILCDNENTPQWNMITSKGKLLFYGEWSGIKIVPVEIGDSFVYRIDNVFYVDGTGNLLSFV